jgi:hypothetical protein
MSVAGICPVFGTNLCNAKLLYNFTTDRLTAVDLSRAVRMYPLEDFI